MGSGMPAVFHDEHPVDQNVEKAFGVGVQFLEGGRKENKSLTSQDPDAVGGGSQNYDLSPNQRFLMVLPGQGIDGAARSPQLVRKN